ncbi:MAG: flippase activity-associated protein Agl23 [Acidobacteriota bacterium]
MTGVEAADPAEERIAPAFAAGRGRRLLIGLFLLAAVATRFIDLGGRPLHHDESIHAFQSYTLSKEGNWRYDPAYHGPFLYYANALVYKIFGATNTTARILPAAFGVGLLLFAIPLVSWFGIEAAVFYALLVLISPHLAYFSRFIREDLYSLVFTFGTIVAFRRFLETDRSRWLTLSAVSFALAGATKENAYMTGVLFVFFGLWVFVARALEPSSGGAAAAVRATWAWVMARFVPLLIAGIVFLSIWSLLYSAFGRYPSDWLAIPKAVKYWMGQHAIARIPGPWYYYFPQLVVYESATLVAALLLLRRPDIRRDRFVQSVGCVAAGLFFGSIASSLLASAASARIVFLGFSAAGIFLALARLRTAPLASDERASPFLRFVVYWALSSLAIYAWAREKVPWLTVHPLLPLTILAGIAIAGLWRERREPSARLGLAAVALLAALNASGMYLACFRYGAHDVAREPAHAEMLAYVQTTRDLVRALEVVEKARGRVPAGQNVITVSGEASWPLTWYLRDTPTTWAPRIQNASTPIIVADWDAEGGLEKQLAGQYTARRVPIRAWWFPGRVAPAPAADGKPATPDRPTVADLVYYALFHQIWSPIGSQDATFFVRKDLEQGTGTLEPLNLTLQDPTARDYNGDAAIIPPIRTQGAPGNGAGEFSEPRGLAVDGHGTLYVADTKNSRVQVFDGNGQFVRQFGSKGQAPNEFNEPCGLTVDAQGDLWVADTWNARIVHYRADGAVAGVIGGTGTDIGFFGPRAVVASRGVIYVADTGNKRIVRFDPSGKKLGEFGGEGSGEGQMVEPVGLAADASGRIYVADTGNHRVQVFDADGKFVRQFPVPGWKDFYTEPYIAIGPADTVIVTDAWGGRVAAYDPKGVMRRSWKTDKDFKQPTGIAVDAFGRVTVSDRGTHRLFTWPLTAVLP